MHILGQADLYVISTQSYELAEERILMAFAKEIEMNSSWKRLDKGERISCGNLLEEAQVNIDLVDFFF